MYYIRLCFSVFYLHLKGLNASIPTHSTAACGVHSRWVWRRRCAFFSLNALIQFSLPLWCAFVSIYIYVVGIYLSLVLYVRIKRNSASAFVVLVYTYLKFKYTLHTRRKVYYTISIVFFCTRCICWVADIADEATRWEFMVLIRVCLVCVQNHISKDKLKTKRIYLSRGKN